MFQLVQESYEFIDYDAHVPDRNEAGLTMRISFERGLDGTPMRAYMVIRGDDMSGETLFEHEIYNIPLDWAVRITGRKE